MQRENVFEQLSRIINWFYAVISTAEFNSNWQTVSSGSQIGRCWICNELGRQHFHRLLWWSTFDTLFLLQTAEKCVLRAFGGQGKESAACRSRDLNFTICLTCNHRDSWQMNLYVHYNALLQVSFTFTFTCPLVPRWRIGPQSFKWVCSKQKLGRDCHIWDETSFAPLKKVFEK